MKTLQSKEKEEVSLQERKKHASGKAKKVKKALHDVGYFSKHSLIFLLSKY